jgi:1-acyl-sn-glycerol-3-phosphate acyltransferase
MHATPFRLKAKRIPLSHRTGAGGDDGTWGTLTLPSSRRILRRVRAIRCLVLVLLWTVVAAIVQAVLLTLPDPAATGRSRAPRPKVGFAQFYWATMCRLIGLRVRTIGAVAQHTADGRPIVYVSNHSSWLDILVLGGQLRACFIAKEEVARWPVVSLIAWLGRTVYVRRQRTSIGRERDEMRRRLARGDGLILFPEGTTSDGSRVLPFRSAFLAVAELSVTQDGKPPLVQPISVVYDRLAGLPIGRARRPLFAWYGDMDIGSHFWRLVQHRGLRATVLLHVPLDPKAYSSRKALAQAAWVAVAEGAAALRQNRPARPVTAGDQPAAESSHPAYA